MKTYLTFDELFGICSEISEELKADMPDELVAISRGGLVPATIIAKMLRLPVGVFIPKTSKMQLVNSNAKKIVFVEDLIAEGRTYRLVEKFMTAYNDGYAEKVQWKFVPILVDEKAPITPEIYGIKTGNWIVMPWEKFDDMKEGDRGLFRDNTDEYSKNT